MICHGFTCPSSISTRVSVSVCVSISVSSGSSISIGTAITSGISYLTIVSNRPNIGFSLVLVSVAVCVYRMWTGLGSNTSIGSI